MCDVLNCETRYGTKRAQLACPRDSLELIFLEIKPLNMPVWHRRDRYKMETFFVYYFFMKLIFFYGLVRSQVRYDLVRDHYIFLAMLYTAGVAFLSLAFLVSWGGQNVPNRAWELRLSERLGATPWVVWLGETLLISTIYFKLMARFDEGVVFWTLLLLGVFVVLF